MRSIKVRCRTRNPPTSSVSEHDAHPAKSLRDIERTQIKALTEERMMRINDADPSHLPIRNRGSLQ
jgi:hypothetical protein